MRLTIIVPDNMVGIDGVFYEIDLKDKVPTNLHALQWYGDYGEEEYNNKGIPENKNISDISPYQIVIDEWSKVDQLANVPEPEPTLEEKQYMAWERIKEERARRLFEGGFYSSGFWWHSDTDSKVAYLRMEQQANELLKNGASMDDPIKVDGDQQQWKLMDNSFVGITVGLITQLGIDAEAQVSRIFKAAEIHKAQMMDSSDPDKYDISLGWPASYWDTLEN